MEFINTQISLYPELVDDYTILGNYHDKKYWLSYNINFISNNNILIF